MSKPRTSILNSSQSKLLYGCTNITKNTKKLLKTNTEEKFARFVYEFYKNNLEHKGALNPFVYLFITKEGGDGLWLQQTLNIVPLPILDNKKFILNNVGIKRIQPSKQGLGLSLNEFFAKGNIQEIDLISNFANIFGKDMYEIYYLGFEGYYEKYKGIIFDDFITK